MGWGVPFPIEPKVIGQRHWVALLMDYFEERVPALEVIDWSGSSVGDARAPTPDHPDWFLLQVSSLTFTSGVESSVGALIETRILGNAGDADALSELLGSLAYSHLMRISSDASNDVLGNEYFLRAFPSKDVLEVELRTGARIASISIDEKLVEGTMYGSDQDWGLVGCLVDGTPFDVRASNIPIADVKLRIIKGIAPYMERRSMEIEEWVSSYNSEFVPALDSAVSNGHASEDDQQALYSLWREFVSGIVSNNHDSGLDRIFAPNATDVDALVAWSLSRFELEQLGVADVRISLDSTSASFSTTWQVLDELPRLAPMPYRFVINPDMPSYADPSPSDIRRAGPYILVMLHARKLGGEWKIVTDLAAALEEADGPAA